MVILNSERLQQEMARQGLTAMELAMRCGIHLNSYYRIRRGGPVSSRLQQSLFSALGGVVPVEELFTVTVSETPKRRR
ncbi:MAG: helix-turn-helix transcriptional regulator [Armatimonadia bacterium]